MDCNNTCEHPNKSRDVHPCNLMLRCQVSRRQVSRFQSPRLAVCTAAVWTISDCSYFVTLSLNLTQILTLQSISRVYRQFVQLQRLLRHAKIYYVTLAFYLYEYIPVMYFSRQRTLSQDASRTKIKSWSWRKSWVQNVFVNHSC